MNIVINQFITFGKYSGNSHCAICHENMHNKLIVNITECNQRKDRDRSIRMHLTCANGLKDKEITYRIFKDLITSNRYGCSYCEKIDANKELKNIGTVYLHPHCCDLLEKKLKKEFELKKEELLLKMI